MFPVALTVLSACQQPVPDSGAHPLSATPQVAVQHADRAPVDLEGDRQAAAAFALPASYASARTELLGAGWRPLRDPECWTNVGGRAEVCSVLPETEACSSDGHCVMHFGHVGQAKTLRVITYGDWRKWNAAGTGGLQVKASQASTLATVPSLAYPASTFDGVLPAFAADEATRAAFTAPLVRVAELNSTDDGDVPREVLVRGGA
ncbi:hypothetical protein ACF3M1_09865 [Luteimonas sp. WGS1318]|uniref:hypothetical protein n=1 Tax=Luteimonas sp. WGS1318 TaxID=3366815 RepID=UPI00372D2318